MRFLHPQPLLVVPPLSMHLSPAPTTLWLWVGTSVFSSVKGTYSPPAAHWREGWGGHAHGYGDSSKWCYSGGAMDTNLDGPGCPTPHLTHLSYILQGPSSWLL